MTKKRFFLGFRVFVRSEKTTPELNVRSSEPPRGERRAMHHLLPFCDPVPVPPRSFRWPLAHILIRAKYFHIIFALMAPTTGSGLLESHSNFHRSMTRTGNILFVRTESAMNHNLETIGRVEK